MTKEALKSTLRDWLQKAEKYKFAVLILLVGVVLMLLPTGQEEDSPKESEVTAPEKFEDLEAELERLLCQIDGAGEVNVMLSIETGPSVAYQENVEKSSEGERQEIRQETVLVSNNGNEVPVVIETTYPIYKGAVVVCQGADSPVVKLRIVQAVSSITGLGSDKITVVRMKGN